MENTKKTLVLGASDNPARYSYLAVNRLRNKNHPVIAIGKKQTTVADVEVKDHPVRVENIHTITLYLNSKNQQAYYNYILGIKPKRIIFNPGAENDELAEMAAVQGIHTMEACTLVLLATGQY